ncbi:Bgt-20057 [Blumeria graminis f. sp. tritici]|uniref:Bgt-20057 n=2 Tax=Blumeria graminis f. sp. tritici TaxID=62690 RepID=A0A381LD73_BLUGR|nr:Bgt-20057 [Blumeria graminis f. sp. tritici]
MSKLKALREKDRSHIVEKSLILDMFEIAFDFHSDAILLGYTRYAEPTRRLHWHHWRVKSSSLPAWRPKEV